MDLRAVVFDYGMVLSAPPDPTAHRRMIEITGLSPELFEQLYWGNRESYDSGALSGEAFWRKFAQDADISLTTQQVDSLNEADARMWMVLDQPTLAWARQVRAAGFKIGILSNIGDTLVSEMRKQFAWLSEFDHSTWSYEIGLVKPQAGIYQYTLEKLGVEPHQALMLDDKAVNIRGAEAIGMHGIVFTSLPNLVTDLKARGLDRVLPSPMTPAVQEV